MATVTLTEGPTDEVLIEKNGKEYLFAVGVPVEDVPDNVVKDAPEGFKFESGSAEKKSESKS